MVYYGCKLVANVQAVEDIVTEVFLTYNRKGYTDERLLYVFVKRLCLNYIRDQKVRRYIEVDESVLNLPVDNEIIETGLLDYIQTCIDKLPPETRRVVVMFYFEGKQCKQIAQELGKPDATVRSIKRYAIFLLQGLIKEKQGSQQPGS